jgi:hypothetical protein
MTAIEARAFQSQGKGASLSLYEELQNRGL